MAGKNEPEAGENPLSATAVNDYLLANPGFFQAHKTLLTKLTIPHPAGGAVSLVERQVEVLRHENRRLEQRLIEWMGIARENDQLLAHLHGLAVALLAESDHARRLEVLADSLHDHFKAAASTVILLEPTPGKAVAGIRYLARDDAAFADLKDIPQAKRPICRSLTPAQSQALFPATDSMLGSAAFIPIAPGGTPGLVLVASTDPKHFHPALDTAYLSRLGELVQAALHPPYP